MSETMQGRRLPDSSFGDPGGGWADWKDSDPGDYMKVTDELGGKTVWYIRDPWGHVGALRTHTVTEHDDGTITVSPSILDPDPPSQAMMQHLGIVAMIPEGGSGWHGWLERGVWRTA